VGYDIVAYKVRYLQADTSTGLPGGTVTLSLPPSDVPAAPNQLLIDVCTVVCAQGAQSAAALYDLDPTQYPGIPPLATTQNGNLDQGESAGGLVIPAGANLFIQWTGVLAGSIPRARVQFRLVTPVAAAGQMAQAHPILSA
jgi:hypothetical protein